MTDYTQYEVPQLIAVVYTGDGEAYAEWQRRWGNFIYTGDLDYLKGKETPTNKTEP